MQKKQVVILGNLPSQLCVLDSPATLRSSVLSFLFKFNPYSFPPKKPLHFSLFSSLCVFSFSVSPPIHWSASMACPTTLPAAARLLQPTSSPQLPGCRSHLAGIHGHRGGVPLTPQKNNQNCPLPSQKAPL